MTKQIFISGSSGSGKTTLANYISHRYQIPFISCSTKNLWPNHGISDHKEIITRSAKDPNWGKAFQHELLEYRKEVLSGHIEFVTDRSPLDSILYFMLQNSPFLPPSATQYFIDQCRDIYHLYDAHQIYLEPSPYLENDGMRISNHIYQEMTHCIMKYMIENNWLGSKKRVTVIKEWDWEYRVRVVEELFKPEEKSLWQELKENLGL